jgi:predicted transcriptional regulator
MDLPELKELNLTKGQIKVYQAVLDTGIAGIQNIQEKTGLERRAIYDILNKLIEKGFTSYVEEKGHRKYQCTHPRNLKEAIQTKQNTLKELQNKLPQITDLFNYNKPKIAAEVYRGNEAMKALLNEALEHKATYWIGGNSGVEVSTDENMKRWFHHWMQKRAEQKKFMYDLVDYGTNLEGLKPNDIKTHKKQYYKHNPLPKDLVSPIVIIIFGNKVAQVLWSKQSFAFVLESEEIKDSFMKYFNYFWKDPW